jgi:hypothetical protein
MRRRVWYPGSSTKEARKRARMAGSRSGWGLAMSSVRRLATGAMPNWTTDSAISAADSIGNPKPDAIESPAILLLLRLPATGGGHSPSRVDPSSFPPKSKCFGDGSSNSFPPMWGLPSRWAEGIRPVKTTSPMLACSKQHCSITQT